MKIGTQLQHGIAIVFAMIALLGQSGCTTLADARAGKGSGVSRTYDASVDKVWSVLPAAVKELGLDYVAENKAEGYALAQRSMTAFSYGENVAIFVEKVGNEVRTRVEVVSKKSVQTTIFAPDWAEPLLNKIGEKLK